MWAVKNGDIDKVKTIVESSQEKLTTMKINGRQPIIYAADFGQKEVIEYLISEGADVNSVDKHGITPLLAAIWEGHTKCVEVILAKGGSKDGKAPDGSTYLESATKDEIKALLR